MLDTYQRYITPYQYLLDHPSISKLLDIGSNGAGFARYNPRPEIKQVNLDILKPDPQETENFPHVIFKTYDGHTIPYKDQYFDLTICIDTFEHIPPEQRTDFVKETLRVTKQTAIFTFPVFTSAAWDKLLSQIFLNKIVFLREHEEYGLPHPDELLKHIKKSGFKLQQQQQNMNIFLWLPFKLTSSLLYRYLKYKPQQAEKLFHFYRRHLARFVNFGQGYSQTFILTRND